MSVALPPLPLHYFNFASSDIPAIDPDVSIDPAALAVDPVVTLPLRHDRDHGSGLSAEFLLLLGS
jgi:hypothetical protein